MDSVFCHRVVFDGDESDATVVDRRNHLPTPRASHSLNLLSGCLLLFGGGSAGGSFTASSFLHLLLFLKTIGYTAAHVII